MNSNPHLILASGSPRRQEILRNAGFNFEVFTKDFEEHFPENMPVREVASFLAVGKNDFYRSFFEKDLILTADTTVVLGDIILNKPEDDADAQRMLKLLSANTHEVVTGVCISNQFKSFSFSEITEVTFHSLSNEEIDFYIRSCQPFDKAGAYGVQDWLGLIKVKELRGSFYNVMGLPVDRVYQILKQEFDFTLP